MRQVGGVVYYYSSVTDWTSTTLTYQEDVWQKHEVDHTIGTNTFTYTIDGVSDVMIAYNGSWGVQDYTDDFAGVSPNHNSYYYTFYMDNVGDQACVLTGAQEWGYDYTPSVIHTPWEKDPQKRYKMITFVYALGSNHPYDEGYWGSYSPDGIHWRDVPKNPVLLDTGDVGVFAWDPHKEQYMANVKIWTTVPRHDGYRRCIGLTTTKDFEHWPYPELVLVPDEIDDNWVTSEGQCLQRFCRRYSGNQTHFKC